MIEIRRKPARGTGRRSAAVEPRPIPAVPAPSDQVDQFLGQAPVPSVAPTWTGFSAPAGGNPWLAPDPAVPPAPAPKQPPWATASTAPSSNSRYSAADLASAAAGPRLDRAGNPLAPTEPAPPERLDRNGRPIPPLSRAREGRIIGGVSAGIAAHLRVPAVWVRLAFCLLALMSGVGVAAYAMLWIWVPQAPAGQGAPQPSGTERRQAIGIAALGAALAVVGAAFGFGTSIGWIIGPLGLAAVGGAFIWREADDARRQKWRRSAVGVVGDGSGALWRVIGGVTLVVGGLAVFALGQFDFSATGGALLAVVLTLIGVAIILIPWWVRLVRDLGAERRELVAQQERAEIAAHLHDSVLQTLALIQRQSGDAREVLRLSRSQERELRSWLYGPAGYATGRPAVPGEPPAAATVSLALAEAAGEVEDTYAVQVTPVAVGDVPMDSEMHALVAAAREAMVNAAKHSGVAEISLYAEVEDGTDSPAVTVFVRDRGKGFDPARVGTDRRGLAESVRGRMDRHGGLATVRSTPGEGTEVELRMPISHRADAPDAGIATAVTTQPVPGFTR